MQRRGIRVGIVGAGPTGLTAAILLQRYGIDVSIFDSKPGTSALPQAHVINTRTAEIMRQIGMLPRMEAISVPEERMRHKTWSESLAGVHYGDWLFVSPNQHLSPTRQLNFGQDRFEAILADAAAERGVAPLFNHEVTDFDVQGELVNLSIREPGGTTRREIFDYVLACDGARSNMRRALGVTLEGHQSVARMVTCYFKADLSRYYKERPGPVRFIAGPDVRGSIIGFDLESTWAFICMMPEGEDIGNYTPEVMQEVLYRAIGDRSVKTEIIGIAPWNMSAQVAERYRDGPILLLGDAAHRFPPTGGLGLNTGVQDAHNLAWKLSWIDRGLANPGLLDTYEAERKPVAARNCDQSYYNAVEMRVIDDAIGARSLAPMASDVVCRPPSQPAELGFSGPADEAGKRKQVQDAIATYSSKFDVTDVEIGFRYEKGAIDISNYSAPDDIYEPGAFVGGRLPHIWIDTGGGTSSLDLISEHALTLFVSQRDCELARLVSSYCHEAGLPLEFVETAEWSDGGMSRWAAATLCNAGEAILTRPDGHVAWISCVTDAVKEIRSLQSLLRTLKGESNDAHCEDHRRVD